MGPTTVYISLEYITTTKWTNCKWFDSRNIYGNCYRCEWMHRKLTESIINEGGPNVTITGTNPNCIGDDVTLTANPSPKTPTSYTYKWSDGLGTNQTANVNNVLITKDYFVTITDIETGCTSIGSFTLEVVGCAIITHKRFCQCSANWIKYIRCKIFNYS